MFFSVIVTLFLIVIIYFIADAKKDKKQWERKQNVLQECTKYPTFNKNYYDLKADLNELNRKINKNKTIIDKKIQDKNYYIEHKKPIDTIEADIEKLKEKNTALYNEIFNIRWELCLLVLKDAKKAYLELLTKECNNNVQLQYEQFQLLRESFMTLRDYIIEHMKEEQRMELGLNEEECPY